MTKTHTITVGRLLCGQVREYLEDCVFRGAPIKYRESKGFLEREFTFTGEPEAVDQILNSIQSAYGSTDS